MKYRLVLNCQQVHELISQGMDRELHLHEKTRMRMHLAICKHCRNYEQQMQFLRGAMRRWMELPEENDTQPSAQPEGEQQ